MRQRVAFLRTLLAGKPVLLLDEPFASLDAITRAEMQEWLAEALAAESRTVILVTHDVEEALYLVRPRRVLSARPGELARRARRAGPRARSRAWTRSPPRVRGGARARAGGARAGERDESAGCRRWRSSLALLGAWELAARLGRARRRAQASSPSCPGPERDRRGAVGGPRAARRKRLGHPPGGARSASRSPSLAGVGFAVVLHLSPTLRRAFYPLLVASQTVPIIVIAPILVVWFGFGIGPKLAIIALICFFPITVNTLDGLRSVDPDLVKMMRTLDAGRWQTLRRVEAPTALPYFFSGAKIAVAVAVIGAVFGEWAGSELGPRPPDPAGLGAAARRARTFAAVVVLSAFAIALFALLAALERRVAWWGPTARVEPTGGGPLSKLRTRRSHRGLALALPSRRWPPAAARSRRTSPRRAAALRRRARLLRQPRPRRPLRGARARLLPRRRARRPPAGPLGPLGADQAGRRRPGGPRDLLRARGAARPRPGPAVIAVARARGEPLTSLIWLQGSGIASSRTSRQDGRHRRHPVPGGLPRDDPRALPA